MRSALPLAFLAGAFFLSSTATAQEPNASAPSPKAAQDVEAKKQTEAEAELQKALAEAGDDSAALVRDLTAYLARFPDSPRRPSIYRALVEACQQIRNNNCALDYAERFIALRPDDSQMMLLATSLLQKKGDDASLVRASGYVSRVLDRVEKTLPEEKPASESLAEWQDGHSAAPRRPLLRPRADRNLAEELRCGDDRFAEEQFFAAQRARR